MKHIKKLSSKLLLVLGVMILSVIVWQVIVSKRVIGDMEKIRQVQSVEQVQELLKNKELKTYHAIPIHPFSKIRINEIDAHILKGDKYEIYVSDYIKRSVEIVQNEDELVINTLGEESPSAQTPVVIFMPEDPQSVHYGMPNNQCHRNCKLYGFKGDNTFLSLEGGLLGMHTDMPFINIKQKDNDLVLFTIGSNHKVQMNVNAENSIFNFNNQVADSINLNIQLQESVISQISFLPQSKIGTLSLEGTLAQNPRRPPINGTIEYPGQCDSLIIQLANNTENVQQLFLSKELSGSYENIDISENIVIKRGE